MNKSNEKPGGQPVPGQWAKQQKKGMEKQQQGENRQKGQQGGAGEPQTTPLEPEKQGGIGGP